jgi:hypothetical protein
MVEHAYWKHVSPPLVVSVETSFLVSRVVTTGE